MQADRRSSTAQLHNLHLTPFHTMDTSAECLTNRLFRREATRETRNLTPALEYFLLCKDTLEEALRVPFVHLADTVYLDDVDANRYIKPVGLMEWRGQTCHTTRTKEPIRDRFSSLANQWSKQQ